MTEQKLSLADLATGLSRRAKLPMRYSEDFVRSFFKVIGDGLTVDNLVKIKGFGTFKLIGIEARESINVATGERFEIAGHTKVSFTPDPTLRDAVNRPFVEFETVILSDAVDTKQMEAIGEEAQQPVQEEPQKPIQEDIPEAKIVSLTAVELDEEGKTEPVADSEPDPGPVVEPEPSSEPELEPEPESDKFELDESESDEVSDDDTDTDSFQLDTPYDNDNETMNTCKIHFTWLHCLWALLFALFFTALGYAIAYYWHPIALPEFNCQQEVIVSPSTDDFTEEEDTIVQIISDESELNARVDSSAVAAASYPQLEGGEYIIVGVLANDTMKAGKMLSKMAIQYYGDKDLYKYICTMNNIDNPDIVPLNMPLLIPKLEKKQESSN